MNAPREGARARVALGVAALGLALLRARLGGDVGLVVGGLLLGFWALAAWSVGTRAALALEPASAGASLGLRALVLAWSFVVVLMAAAGAAGAIALLPITFASAVAYALAGPVRSERFAALDPRELARAARGAPVAALVIAFTVGLGALALGWAAVSSVTATDDLAYHLAAPVEWVRTGRIGYQFLPFGNHSPPYYPMLTELGFAWAYLPLRELAATKLVQAPLFVLGALAVYVLVRELGGSKRASALAAAFAATHPTFVWYLATNHVDGVFAGLFVASLVFVLRLRREPSPARCFELCLVLGLFLGTKVLAVLMGALVLAPVTAVLLFPVRRELGRALRTRATWLAGGLAFLATGGWWYVRNWVWSGNPLFPLLVEFGGVRVFDGAYDRSDLPGSSASVIPRLFVAGAEKGRLVEFLPALPLAIGLVVAIASLRTKRARAALGAGLVVPAMIALAYLGFCPWPYARFLLALPLFASALLAPALDGPRSVARATELALAASLAAAICLPAGGWDALLPRAFPGLRIAPLVLAGTALGAAAALAWGASIALRTERRGALVAFAGLVSLALLPVVRRTSDPAGPHVVEETRALWRPYIALEALAPGGARVAQAGSRLLLGAQGWRGRNVARYVQVDEGADAFHERVRALADRRDELRHDRTGFGYYRAHPDEAAWERNLARFGAQFLVCEKLAPWIASRENYHRTADGFPIEAEWAEAAPQRFRRVYADEGTRIYALTGANE